MRSTPQVAIAITLLLACATPAYAQVCKEPGVAGSGKANLNCDMSYRDTLVTCDKKLDSDVLGTRPACPKKPMPMIDTPKRSYYGDYSDYLFTYPRDEIDRSRPYAGTYSIGTQGDAGKTFQMFGNTTTGSKRMAACTTQLKLPNDPKNAAEEAAFVRLQIDNCANQYILNDAIYPFQKEAPRGSRMLSGENPADPSERIDLKSECQPLRTFRDSTNEYSVSEYLKLAWEKTLQNPGKRKTTGGAKGKPCAYSKIAGALLESYGGDSVGTTVPCDREPHLPDDIKIENPLDFPNKLKNPPEEEFPDVQLSEISAIPYEQIVDPTHPFSPRWDFLITDREYSKYSAAWLSVPKAGMIYGLHSIYMENPEDTIFCAGLKKEKNSGGGGSTGGGGNTGGGGQSGSTGNKKQVKILVDVLEFRRSAFEKALLKRVTYNDICYKHQAQFTSGNDAYWIVMLFSYCNAITGFSFVYPWVYGKDFDCWKCFGLESNKKVDDEKTHPPCTTNYLGKDLKMKMDGDIMFPGLLNMFSQSAQCNGFMGARDDKYRMDNVCKNLRKPYTQMNKLKMRYHNMEGDKDSSSTSSTGNSNSGNNSKDGDDNVLVEGALTSETLNLKESKNGALEGLTFKEYFGDHMPYPRIWDTGSSLQKTANSDANDQPPLDTTGQYTAIVGVGREAAAKSALGNNNSSSNSNTSSNDDKVEHLDERCRGMGWKSTLIDAAGKSLAGQEYGGMYDAASGLFHIPTGGVKIYAPDPMTSWTEMKMYQARTMRNTGISCIGRYEKVFKSGSAENMILMATGAEWSRLVISKCDKKEFGKVDNCTYMKLKDYIKETSKKNDSGDSTSTQTNDKKDDKTIYLTKPLPDVWPSAWRGYMAAGGFDLLAKTKFPFFPNGPPASLDKLKDVVSTGGLIYSMGLSNAQQGDVIMLPFGPKNSPIKPGLAKLALVIETNLPGETNCEDEENCYVKVLEPDNGKFPDICGTTDTWGEMKARYYYKPGHLPQAAKKAYELIKATSSCEETRISQCEMPSWNTLAIYRIRNDIRKGCEKKDKAIECKKDEEAGGAK